MPACSDQLDLFDGIDEPKRRRNAKHDRDPRDKYIRRVKNRYQVRPYCPIAQERYCLPELFTTLHEARKARDEFWWGRRRDCERFTRKVNFAAGEQYLALVPWRGRTFRAGPFATREAAGFAVLGILAVIAVCPEPPKRT
jgi:hypothetical protein